MYPSFLKKVTIVFKTLLDLLRWLLFSSYSTACSKPSLNIAPKLALLRFSSACAYCIWAIVGATFSVTPTILLKFIACVNKTSSPDFVTHSNDLNQQILFKPKFGVVKKCP